MFEKKIDWCDLAVRLFEKGGKKTYHIDEIVDLAVDINWIPMPEDAATFRKKLNSFLASNVRSKTPQFSKVSNKKGGFRKGFYKLKPQKSLILAVVTQEVSTQFTGAAGEYSVMSELLFRGYNASKMTVDDGIDLVASKAEKYFHIQVKTANSTNDKPFRATIRKKTFQHSTIAFYVVVLRSLTPSRYNTDFVIFPSSLIRQFVSQGVVKDGTTMSLGIAIDSGRYILNGKLDITTHINDWDAIS